MQDPNLPSTTPWPCGSKRPTAHQGCRANTSQCLGDGSLEKGTTIMNATLSMASCGQATMASISSGNWKSPNQPTATRPPHVQCRACSAGAGLPDLVESYRARWQASTRTRRVSTGTWAQALARFNECMEIGDNAYQGLAWTFQS